MKASSFGARFWAILIFALLAAKEIERGVCLARHSDVPGPSVLVQLIVFTCLIVHWVRLDGRERQMLSVWDMGFLLAVAWPVIVPYYLVKTRGIKRAFAIFFLLAVVSFGGFATGTIISRLAR